MKKILMASAIALALSAPAMADNTDSATVEVEGEIIDTLTVQDATITMPDLVKPDGALSEPNTSATLTCASDGTGTVSYTANGSPFADGNTAPTTGVEAGSANAGVSFFNATGDCGEFVVSGQADAHYTFSATPGTGSNSGVTLTGLNCISKLNSSTSGGTITATGSDSIYCGATVEADSTAWVSYALAGSLVVTYD